VGILVLHFDFLGEPEVRPEQKRYSL